MLLKWTSKLFFKNLTKAISFAISLIVVFTLFSSPSIAAKTAMTGDYTKDTISVVKTLQTAVDTPKDSPNKDEVRSEVRSEALTLITDYISRYRNRGMVNKTQSFTTMQTALNAMAGHYKNFASRPLPDKLKERLTKEFSLAIMLF